MALEQRTRGLAHVPHDTCRQFVIVAAVVTKPETNFADDDRAMARRALWILEGHAPGREQPPVDLDMSRLYSRVGSDGFLTPLAHFALNRSLDARRAAPSVEVKADALPEVAESQLHLQMQAEASVAEKKANVQLREGKLRVGNAIAHWREASDKRADEFGRVPVEFLTGEHHAVFAELLAAGQAIERALELMDGSMRRIAPGTTGAPFPSTLGLPKAERNLVLNAQALRLSEAGHSLEEIAYVMGWDGGTPNQVRDRTRKKLEEARAREPSSKPDD
jgi:hypothetical protein